MEIPRLVFAALFCAVGFGQTGGQANVWTPHGPEGGNFGGPAIDPRSPGTLYVTSFGRLFKTTDAAGHWSALSSSLITVLAVDPRNSSTLYGTNNNALFKSTDGGLTWNPFGGPRPCPCYDLSLVIDPGNPSTLYAAYSADSNRANGGVFKSTDGGATWNPASTGLPGYQTGQFTNGVHALAIDPRNPGTLYAATGLVVEAGGGLFKSTDGAMSWSPVNSGLRGIPDAPVIDPRNSNILYLDGGYFKSTDGGSSWVNTGFNGRNLVVDPQDSAVLYAVRPDGIVKSTDGGGNWNVILPGATNASSWWVAVTLGGDGGTHPFPRRLGRSSTVYAGTGWLGIFKSSDGGSTWAAANYGLFGLGIYTLAIDPRNPRTLYAGVSGAGLLKSADGAASWSTTPIKYDFATLAFDPRNQGTVYASSAPGVQKSIDGGQTWVQLSLGDVLGYTGPVAIDMQKPDTIYFGGLKSSDAGASWVNLAGYAGYVTALATDPQTAGTIYAGSEAGGNGVQPSSVTSGVLKSVDGGGTWTGVNTLWQAVDVSGVLVDPTNSSVVYASTTILDCSWYDCSGYPDGYSNSPEVLKMLGQFKSTDGGATWVKLDGVSLLGFDQQGRLYAVTPAGFARSQDHGATWNALPTAGLIAGIGVVAFDPQNPNHLFTGTAAGVFEITLVSGNE